MTAVGTALMRAVHTRTGDPPLLDDPWGDRLFRPAEGADDLDARLRAHPNFGTVVIRARVTEDALAEAVARGVRQYVVVGAGMDSFALRRPSFAESVEVFEVDHPDTQAFKLTRLSERGVEQPEGLRLIAADLGETALDVALAGSPYRPDEPAFFAWLGVTSYLTREENLETMRAIARAGAPGSEVVLSYLDADGMEALAEVRASLAEAGEPWRCAYGPGEMAADLRAAGLEPIEDLGPAELRERHCRDRRDGLLPTPGARLARARVG